MEYFQKAQRHRHIFKKYVYFLRNLCSVFWSCYYYYYCACDVLVGMCSHLPWCMCGGQRTAVELALSFPLCVGSRDWAQVVRLALHLPLPSEPPFHCRIGHPVLHLLFQFTLKVYTQIRVLTSQKSLLSKWLHFNKKL